jgi:carbon monoxide dehydrogenase subunit G
VELEKTLTVAAPRSRVWELLLDPKIMAGCVPGTQSVEVLSAVEYLAEIKVKISFIAARFKIRTKIVESRPPEYLRIEGTGEDSTVASSMKQSSELFLTDLGDGNTQIRIKVTADVLGRLGSFGLSVMKTKADRMWDEFGANFSAIATRSDGTNSLRSEDGSADRPSAVGPKPQSPPASRPAALAAPQAVHTKARWWQRITGKSLPEQCLPVQERRPTDIYMEFHRPDGVIKVLWPASAAQEAMRWLKELG